MSNKEKIIKQRWKRILAKPGKVENKKVLKFAFEIEMFHMRNPGWMASTE